MSTFIIGEAGSNHNGEYSKAISLIDVAKNAGCDAVKFQTFSAATLFSRYTPDFANYKNIYGIIKENEIPRYWHKTLKEYCDDIGIEFMSTPFDEAAVDELISLGVKRLKIAGFESTDPRFINIVAKTGLPLIISLGIKSNVSKVHSLYNSIQKVNECDVTFLHCNNAYPTPYTDINLKELFKYNKMGYNYGLSDHTPGPLVPAIAVGLGATCIEKHFTLDKNLPGPDHHFALDPTELKQMVDYIRIAEKCVGTKDELLTNSEKAFSIGTRSVVTLKPIKAGDVLNESNITTKRPCLEDSIPACYFYEMIGKTIKVDVREDEILTWEMI
ncbi:MAG: N-acetylneuraminate synthase family protein [Rickettsiaceae bacterium]|nr:N-acetylneuraminate synthase family protein [Rickettsiaceae bacterium]